MSGSCWKVCWNLAGAVIFCACAVISLSNNKPLVRNGWQYNVSLGPRPKF